MATYRLSATIGIVALLFALSTARADKDFRVHADAEDVTQAVASDNDQANVSTLAMGAELAGMVTQAERDISDNLSQIINFLPSGSGLDTLAENLDLDIQQTSGDILTLAGQGKGGAAGLRDIVAPAGLFLLGTALTTFAFFTRSTQNHSHRAYFSRHSFIALPPSKARSLRTSPSADSSGPNPRENNVHSSPRRRLA